MEQLRFPGPLEAIGVRDLRASPLCTAGDDHLGVDSGDLDRVKHRRKEEGTQVQRLGTASFNEEVG